MMNHRYLQPARKSFLSIEIDKMVTKSNLHLISVHIPSLDRFTIKIKKLAKVWLSMFSTLYYSIPLSIV